MSFNPLTLNSTTNPKGSTEMNATLTEKDQDKYLAWDILKAPREAVQADDYVLLISQELGRGSTDYLRVSIVYKGRDGKLANSHLTWAIAKAFGYSLRDRSGSWYLAINGGNYSKPDEVARDLAKFYGVERVRYERN